MRFGGLYIYGGVSEGDIRVVCVAGVVWLVGCVFRYCVLCVG